MSNLQTISFYLSIYFVWCDSSSIEKYRILKKYRVVYRGMRENVVETFSQLLEFELTDLIRVN